MRNKIIYIISFVLFLANSLQAQKFNVEILGNEKDSFLSLTKMPVAFNNFTECEQAIQQAKFELNKQGYFAASIDSINWTDTSAKVHVFVGKKYSWATLKNKNIPQNLLTLARFDEIDYFNKPIELKKIEFIFNKIIEYYENNGYPFSYLYLDSLEENNGKIAANLFLEKGPIIKIDSIIINEDANISKNYILHYLGMKEGMYYDERKIKSISKKLRELSFVQEASPWKIYFTSVQTTLHLFLKNKSANQADVLIGLLPNNTEIGNKFLLTGDIKLGLINPLNQGESIQLNWQNLQYQSPRYDIKFQIPYLFKSPIGITGKFDFYKKDTTFKTINGQIGILFKKTATDYFKFYYELTSSRLLSLNKSSIISSRVLPNNADVTYKTFGIETVIQNVDYKLNPRKGYSFFANAGLSFRTFIKNEEINQLFDPVTSKTFSYLYDSITLKNNKYQLATKFQYFFWLKKRLTLATILNAGLTYSNNPLFKNELFQIGGYRLLRGFDEGSLFVNNYEIITIEPRYLLSSNSYFFLFTDVGFIKQKYGLINKKDTTFSIGLGMSFETKAGMFNISYAVGSQQNQGLQFKNSKIHFGYVNYF